MSTLTVQPPTADTRISKGNSTSNYGTQTNLLAQCYNTSTKDWRSILTFDFSALPAGATITNVTLSLYFYNDSSGYSRSLDVYRLTRTDWVETEVTWDNYKSGNAWTTAGGDYTTTDGANTTTPASLNNWVDWDVTAICQWAQANSSEVVHLLLKQTTENSSISSCYFYSREYATDTTKRPKLTITYTAPAAGGNLFTFHG